MFVALAGHALEPWQQPKQADQTKEKKKRTPAIPAHQDAAKEEAEGGSRIKAGDDDGVGQAALLFREIPGEDLRVRRVNHRFADSQNQPRRQQQREAAGKPRRCSRHRPEEKTAGQHPFHVETIDQPAGEHLEKGVAPEKRRQQDSEPEVG